MNAITTQAQSLTLLDLVQALGSVLDDDAAVASAVGTLVNAGADQYLPVNGATAAQPEARGWNDRWSLTLGMNWTNKGTFNATAFYGHMKDPVSGAVGKQQGVPLFQNGRALSGGAARPPGGCGVVPGVRGDGERGRGGRGGAP